MAHVNSHTVAVEVANTERALLAVQDADRQGWILRNPLAQDLDVFYGENAVAAFRLPAGEIHSPSDREFTTQALYGQLASAGTGDVVITTLR